MERSGREEVKGPFGEACGDVDPVESNSSNLGGGGGLLFSDGELNKTRFLNLGQDCRWTEDWRRSKWATRTDIIPNASAEMEGRREEAASFCLILI